MKINMPDRKNMTHLLLLIGFAGFLADFLITKLEFKTLTAWAFAVTVVCQVNSLYISFMRRLQLRYKTDDTITLIRKWREETRGAQDMDEVDLKAKAQTTTAGNPKKKKKNT